MASGVPVVCSNSSSLPEVAGSSALMCDPEDVETLAEHILKGLEDNDWRTEAVESGLNQARMFSWKRCAEQTAIVYRRVLDQ